MAQSLLILFQSLGQRSKILQTLQIRKCIRCHIPVHAIFAVFVFLSRPAFTSRTSKTRRQRNSSTFFSFKFYNPETFMSSAATAFCACAHKKCLAQKVARFGSLGLIPMIQVPFNSSCTALQYKTKTKFFHPAVPELHGIEKFQHNRVVFSCLLEVLMSVWRFVQ